MKRRNLFDGKSRRPVKRPNKISENFYSSTLIYIKLLLLWALVLLADHFLEFRFEYLWPFWLFLRSVYDSFKYQGFAFSVFFICIALTSDMICFLFIPVHWLFFAASTYVWVQYVWHTEKGLCLPTVFLWLLFVYIEASIRLKEFKANIDLKQLPFHMDLCRPFAAHCIGYPVVTLGFGFKSYVGYRMRQRRQKEVQKENEYYYQFLREALPPGVREDAFNPHPSPKPNSEDRISDTAVISSPLSPSTSLPANGHSPSSGDNRNGSNEHLNTLDFPPTSSTSSSTSLASAAAAKLTNGIGNHHSNGSALGSAGPNGDLEYIEKMDLDDKRPKPSSYASKEAKRSRDSSKLSKDEQILKLETEAKKLKVDLQVARNKENELRDQIVSSAANERMLKSEISNLQVEKSILESRVSGLLSTRAGEKAAMSSLEKKLADERKQKAEFQMKLETERKSKKEAANAERTAQQNQTRSEVAKLEAEIKTLRQELQMSRDRCEAAEREVFILRQYKDTHGDPELLVNHLKATQEKNSQLEKSLSSETKLKMDLFSALGDARRELSIANSSVSQKDKEIFDLKAKIAEVLAVMPGSMGGGGSLNSVMQSGSSAAVGSGRGNSSVYVPSTLSLDLPASTDLSFTGKMSSLGLSDLEDKLTSGIYNAAAQLANSSAYTAKTNGNMNGDN